MTLENTSGRTKKYLQLKNVTTTKHAARPHRMLGISDRESLDKPPSCHAKTATKIRRIVTKRPKPV